MSVYYKLRAAAAPWGDYGDLLRNGWTEEAQGHGKSLILVSRTGPFVPPITLPLGRVIVTDDFREKLAAEEFSGLSFEPVYYQRVVHIAWEQWDANAQEPAFYPETGEPEDYLLKGFHDKRLIATMPRLWAWNVAPTIGLQVQGTSTFRRELHPGTDVAGEYFIFWIGERMKLWLEENSGEWLSFVSVVPQ
jgi:hypothetical protein